MSLKAIEWARDISGCNSAEKAVLFVLADAYNGKTGKCCPGQATIAARAGMTEKPLRKTVAGLIMKGFISRTIRSKGSGLITDYTLHFDQMEPRRIAPPPNGTRVPTADDEPNGTRVPVAQQHTKRDTGPVSSPQPNGRTKREFRGGPNGIRVPFHIEEPEGTGIPSQTSDEVFEGRSADLFDQPHAETRTEERSPSQPKPRLAEPLSAEKEFIFKNGVLLLTAQGHSQQAARSYLGKLVRDWKPKPVADAIKAAIAENVGDAKAWIPAALKKRKSEMSVRPAPVPEAANVDWCAIVRRWVDDGYWPSTRLGPAPNQVGYGGPLEPLEDLLPELGDHPAAREIQTTINQRQRA